MTLINPKGSQLPFCTPPLPFLPLTRWWLCLTQTRFDDPAPIQATPAEFLLPGQKATAAASSSTTTIPPKKGYDKIAFVRHLAAVLE